MKKYDAVAFLKSLFEERPEISSPDDLPEPWREIYEERAAIMEFCAGLPREAAEHFAFQDILTQMRERHGGETV